jgi:hypothetical protein
VGARQADGLVEGLEADGALWHCRSVWISAAGEAGSACRSSTAAEAWHGSWIAGTLNRQESRRSAHSGLLSIVLSAPLLAGRTPQALRRAARYLALVYLLSCGPTYNTSCVRISMLFNALQPSWSPPRQCCFSPGPPLPFALLPLLRPPPLHQHCGYCCCWSDRSDMPPRTPYRTPALAALASERTCGWMNSGPSHLQTYHLLSSTASKVTPLLLLALFQPFFAGLLCFATITRPSLELWVASVARATRRRTVASYGQLPLRLHHCSRILNLVTLALALFCRTCFSDF